MASAARTTAVMVSRLYYEERGVSCLVLGRGGGKEEERNRIGFEGEPTDTTPITPYPPSSAAFSILTALLFSIDFAMTDSKISRSRNRNGEDCRKIEEERDEKTLGVKKKV